MKQVIVVRNDIKLSTGKIAAQVAHASLNAVKKAKKNKISDWEKSGQKKIVLAASLEQIKKIKEKCDKEKIANTLIIDAGLTEIKPGTVTALGIGPDDEKKIDKITGSLPLLK